MAAENIVSLFDRFKKLNSNLKKYELSFLNHILRLNLKKNIDFLMFRQGDFIKIFIGLKTISKIKKAKTTFERLLDFFIEFGYCDISSRAKLDFSIEKSISIIENKLNSKYDLIISEKELCSIISEIKKIESRVIIALSFSGLTYREIEEMNIEDINFENGTVSVEKISKNQYSSSRKRVLKISNNDIKIIRRYYKQKKLFNEFGIKLFGVLKYFTQEIKEICYNYGFYSVKSFLNEISKLLIRRLHRRGVPFFICMDYMNIANSETYFNVFRTNNLFFDESFILRSLDEAFDLERFRE